MPHPGLLGLAGARASLQVDKLREANVSDARGIFADQVDVRVQDGGVDGLAVLGEHYESEGGRGEERRGRRRSNKSWALKRNFPEDFMAAQWSYDCQSRICESPCPPLGFPDLLAQMRSDPDHISSCRQTHHTYTQHNNSTICLIFGQKVLNILRCNTGVLLDQVLAGSLLTHRHRSPHCLRLQ